jgi:hypothetical protein
MRPTEPVQHDVELLLSGGRVGRRALLRVAAGATLGLPLVLAACGEKVQVAKYRKDYVIDLAISVP